MVGLVEDGDLDRAEVARGPGGSGPRGDRGRRGRCRRPGGAAWTCGCWPTPPKTVRVRRPCTAASGARAASICATSSRVGARISARGRFGVRREPEAESRATSGQQERDGLAGAGAAAAEDVAAGQGVRQRGCLDRSGFGDARRGEHVGQVGGHAELDERRDKGSFANCVSVPPQSRRRLSPRRSGGVEHCPVRNECCNTHQDRGETGRSLCPNRRAQRAKPSHRADVTCRSGPSEHMAQRKAACPVSAWPSTSWCTSVVPS